MKLARDGTAPRPAPIDPEFYAGNLSGLSNARARSLSASIEAESDPGFDFVAFSAENRCPLFRKML
jgi:hypothetical protein